MDSRSLCAGCAVFWRDRVLRRTSGYSREALSGVWRLCRRSWTAHSRLQAQEPPAYFIGYTVTDTQRSDVSGSNGALLSSTENRNRWLEVSVRTGSYTLDNTHKVGERQQAATAARARRVPMTMTTEVLRRAIWLETDEQYAASRKR